MKTGVRIPVGTPSRLSAPLIQKSIFGKASNLNNLIVRLHPETYLLHLKYPAFCGHGVGIAGSGLCRYQQCQPPRRAAQPRQPRPMAINKLTHRDVDRAKAKASDYKLADGGGLYLLVRANGSKLWRMAYRFDGVQKTASFGDADAVGLDAARGKRDDAKALLDKGVDPGQHKREQQEQAKAAARAKEASIRPFCDVADDWFAAMWPSRLSEADRRAGKREHARDRRRYHVTALKEAFGNRPIATITLNDMLRVLDDLERRGVYNQRSRMQGTLNDIWNFALHQEPPLVTRNPIGAIDNLRNYTGRDEHSEPRAALTDPADVGEYLRKVAAIEHPVDRIALQLHSLIFVRPIELMSAQWAHIDFENREMRVPFASLKARTARKREKKSLDDHRVPLARQAIALLRELLQVTGSSGYLFPKLQQQNARRTTKHRPADSLTNAIRKIGYGKEAHCAHGNRSTASTLLNDEYVNVPGLSTPQKRFDADLIELQLDHLSADRIARIYNRGDVWPARVAMMQFWADKLDALRDGSNVVRLTNVA